MTLKNLYDASPFGMVSSFFYGTIQSALFTLLAVYATSMNFTILEISIVTFLLAVSGAISQVPIGKISDIYDRRKVIVFSTFGAAIFALLAIFVSRQMYLLDGLATSKTWFFVFLFFFHSVIGVFGIYRMKVRQTVDNPDSQFVAMPQTITPAGIELNPTTEPIDEPEKNSEETVDSKVTWKNITRKLYPI